LRRKTPVPSVLPTQTCWLAVPGVAVGGAAGVGDGVLGAGTATDEAAAEGLATTAAIEGEAAATGETAPAGDGPAEGEAAADGETAIDGEAVVATAGLLVAGAVVGAGVWAPPPQAARRTSDTAPESARRRCI